MQVKIYQVSEHGIDRNLIDHDALYVVSKLKSAGYEAYIVGGSVRDLLTKRHPKDYDISTSARPEQIKALFGRSCLLIGRRFRLAHIRFGYKIIEVSTFRTGENEGELIVHDNQWGNPEQDVLRRDFTINGLFYDPSNETIIDYVGGWDDIQKHTLRSIGDAVVRFKQDPVRMIRLLKFQARFGFSICPEAQEALFICKEEIVKSSQARVLEEIFRMLESGSAQPFFHLLFQSGMVKLIFPAMHRYLDKIEEKTYFLYLKGADEMNNRNLKNPLDRGILAACLVYPIVEHEMEAQFLSQSLTPHFSDVMLMASGVVKNFTSSSFSHFPKRITTIMNYILATQYRLTPLSGKRHPRPKLIRNKEFALALGFLKIRAISHPELMPLYTSWKELYRSVDKQGDRRGHHHGPYGRHTGRVPNAPPR